MLATLYYLSGFNNYYNRQVKLPDSKLVNDYREWIVQSTKPTAFNPTDWVVSTIECNYTDVDDSVEFDYMLVSEDNVHVSSRWFVVNRKRNLIGQWVLTLRRDLIADYFEEVCSSPVYIEKASLAVNNPLIYNPENLQVNQIKTSETLLKDATGTPWIVLYVDRNMPEAKSIVARADVIDTTDLTYSYEALKSLEGQTLLGDTTESPIASFVADYYNQAPAGGQALGGKYTYFADGTESAMTQSAGWNNLAKSKYVQVGRHPASLEDTKNQFNALVAANSADLTNYIYTVNNTSNQQGLITELNTLVGKTIKDDNSDLLFTADITVGITEVNITIPENSGLYNALNAGIMNIPYIGGHSDPSNNTNTLKISCLVKTVSISNVIAVEGSELRMAIPKAGDRNSLSDAPWDMLAIPYNEMWVRYSATMSLQTLPNVARAIAQSAYANVGDFVKDVQLLPYCPCMEYVNDGILNLSTLTNGVHYSPITTPEETLPVSYGIWCNQSSFRVDIQGFTPIANPLDPIEFKVNNECDMYRLVSPNYSGAFEFSATKNNGITGFEANCTYKPFQPYIHVNPIFSGLYGKDYNDNRGLVCTGNFSMASTGNNWTNYQIQNKAYKESFDRQIENMETTYSISRQQKKEAAVIGAITGAISGAGSGAMLGSSIGTGMAGLGVGAAAGAVAGLAANIYGATKDLEYADKLQAEALDYSKDKFDLSLQNIKALPNTVNNIGAFDINYKYFPFLEYYTCTEVEKETLRKKLKYNGMTVNAIGIISDYLTSGDQFIQGSLIRYLGGNADYHEIAEIANELHKGVYI